MEKYHKINSLFMRDPNGSITGEFAQPEFSYLRDNQWEFTEKVDGMNIRVMWTGQARAEVRFGGKSDNAQIPTKLYERLHDIFDPASFAASFDADCEVCLYGEGFGAKIGNAGGNYLRDRTDFVLFDVKVGNLFLRHLDVENVAEKLSIQCVPIVGYGTLADMVEITSRGFQSKWGPFHAEGVVARPTTELITRTGERIITKLKRKDFLKKETPVRASKSLLDLIAGDSISRRTV